MSAAVSCQLRILDSSSTKTVNAFRRSDASQQVEFSEEIFGTFTKIHPTMLAER
jgi:hypothetical protein